MKEVADEQRKQDEIVDKVKRKMEKIKIENRRKNSETASMKGKQARKSSGEEISRGNTINFETKFAGGTRGTENSNIDVSWCSIFSMKQFCLYDFLVIMLVQYKFVNFRKTTRVRCPRHWPPSTMLLPALHLIGLVQLSSVPTHPFSTRPHITNGPLTLRVRRRFVNGEYSVA
jgi:hypothetical protein